MPGEYIKFNLNDLTISQKKNMVEAFNKRENTQISFKEASKKIKRTILRKYKFAYEK